jgi:hypothetical protein
MREMLAAGGAKHGRFGEAMEIFTAIRQASPKAGEGVMRRLALGTSLEHADPIPQKNPQASPGAPAIVDPVKRYQHYESAFLNGELDPAFKDFSAWEFRMVTNSDAPDEILAWSRDMLRNYRPDHIRTPDRRWRYSILVKTDVLYGSQDVKDDLPELQFYQNILRNGGVCGRRAFFGRTLLRAFGIPVWGVTQKAHAALGRWSPGGWVVNLGAAFKWSWWDKDEVPRSGADFLLETQARAVPGEFPEVLRARWLGELLGEAAFNDRRSVPGGFWSAVALHRSRALAAEAVELGPVGQDVAESNESTESDPVERARLDAAARAVVVGGDGSITIPAVAHAKPANPAAFIPMPGFAGGAQLHWLRDLKQDQHLEFTFEAPRAGTFAFAAHLVTVQAGQQLLLAVNDGEAREIPLPYTIGRWDQSAPVEIALKAGPNTLRITRKAPARGLTLREFTLVPVQ